jgi:hypothetical protein
MQTSCRVLWRVGAGIEGAGSSYGCVVDTLQFGRQLKWRVLSCCWLQPGGHAATTVPVAVAPLGTAAADCW